METLEQRESCMRKVIQHTLDEKPFDELTFEEKRTLKECADKKFIDGIVYVEMISGRSVAEYRHKPRLTLEGIQFMNSAERQPAMDAFNEMSADVGEERSTNNHKKKEHAVKKAFHVIQSVIKKLWWLFCALGAVVTVFGWPLIIQFFTWLLSFFL